MKSMNEHHLFEIQDIESKLIKEKLDFYKTNVAKDFLITIVNDLTYDHKLRLIIIFCKIPKCLFNTI